MFLRLRMLLMLLLLAAKSAGAVQPLGPAEIIDADAPVGLQSLHIHGDAAGSMVETIVHAVFSNPVSAMKTRTIEFKYTETMTRVGKSWTYRLPLDYHGVVGDFKLSFTIRGSGDVPAVDGVFGSPHLDRDTRGYFFQVEKHNFTPVGVVDISIPTAQHALTYVQQYRGETYFVAEIPVAAVSNPRSQVHGVNADGATAIVVDDADAQQGVVRIAGKLRDANARLDMRIVEQGEAKDRSIAISAGDPQHPMAARLWTAFQLRALSEKR